MSDALGNKRITREDLCQGGVDEDDIRAVTAADYIPAAGARIRSEHDNAASFRHSGAACRTRTSDPLITNYRGLSWTELDRAGRSRTKSRFRRRSGRTELDLKTTLNLL